MHCSNVKYGPRVQTNWKQITPPAVTSDALRTNGMVSLLASAGPSTFGRTEMVLGNHSVSCSKPMMTINSVTLASNVIVISMDFTKSNSGPPSILRSVVANSGLSDLGYVSTSVSSFHICFSTNCSRYLVLSVTVPQSDSANTAPSMASAVVPQYYINCMNYYLIP